MGFLDKIKKSIELKQRMPDDESVEKAENKIIKLKKTLEKNPNNSKIITELYMYYVEISDTEKKIECLKNYHNYCLVIFIHFNNLLTSI